MIAARYSWIALLTLATAGAEEMQPEDKTPPAPAPQQDTDKPPGGPKGPRGEGGKDGMRRMMEAWKKADTDGDGFISPVEFGAMERPGQLSEEKRAELFKRFDKDGDGRIGPDEMPKRGPGRMPPLDQADANKDGKIDFAEFKTLEWVKRLPEERQQGIFKRMDTDGDGFLTAKDRREGPRDGRDGRDGKGGRRNLLDLVKDHDKDGNGSLSFAEFRAIPWVKNDGEDKQEERFNEFDKNKDLKIDAADMPPPGEKPDRPDKPKDEGKKKPAEEA